MIQKKNQKHSLKLSRKMTIFFNLFRYRHKLTRKPSRWQWSRTNQPMIFHNRSTWSLGGPMGLNQSVRHPIGWQSWLDGHTRMSPRLYQTFGLFDILWLTTGCRYLTKKRCEWYVNYIQHQKDLKETSFLISCGHTITFLNGFLIGIYGRF